MFFTLVLCAGLATICNGQTGIPLTAEDLANSQLFKSSAGTDRTATFDLLKHLIVTQSGNHEANPPTSFTDKTELLALLGPPDFQGSPTTFGYYLKEINGACVVAIGVNLSNQVRYYSIYDCN